MKARWALVVWASRDLMRRPAEAFLLVVAVAAVTTVAAAPILLTESLRLTAERVLEESPSLVVRHTTPAGYAPLPAEATVRQALSLRGVTEATPRLWGTVDTELGLRTVMGVDGRRARRLAAEGLAPPRLGEVVVGPGATVLAPGDELPIVSRGEIHRFRVVATLPEGSETVAWDVILLHWDDAAQVLGQDPSYATDVALWVFHDSEGDALREELESFLGSGTRITTRDEAAQMAAGQVARAAAAATLALVPAILALSLLVLVTIRKGALERREAGLMKAFGWTTTDLVGLALSRTLVLGVPAVGFGLVAAYGVVIWPGAPLPLGWALGWPGDLPPLRLEAGAATVVLPVVAATVLVPWLVASLWPVIRWAAADPMELIDSGTGEA